MIANYHTHTYRCGHAYGTDREYVEAAIEGGFKILGFAEHTPDWGMFSRTRMNPEQLGGYVADILDLKKEYKDQIEIYVGLEVEYVPTLILKLMDSLKGCPLDYLILGNHFKPNLSGVEAYDNKTENPDMLETYCLQVTEAIESGMFTYWAHPDMVNFQGDEALYEKKMRQMCRIAKKYRMPLEINLHGARFEKQYPNPRFWKIAGEEECEVVFGVDAHDPVELRDKSRTLAVAQKLVGRYNLKLLETVPLLNPIANR